jgi:NarL family two-component system response regulator LiaR
VLVVDDHIVVRRGIRVLLGTERDIEVVGEAEDGREAVAKAESLRPDVILMDLVMPVMDGIEATRRITARRPETRILVLTSFATDDKVFPAMKAGALGYLLKDSSPEQLIAAVHQVHRGEPSLHPAIARKVLQELSRPLDQRLTPEPLTEEEMDVLQLVARGQGNQEIAHRLAVSEATVRSHVNQVLAKLHLADRAQAMLYAMRQGLASLDELAPAEASSLLAVLAKSMDSVRAEAKEPIVDATDHPEERSRERELEALRLIAADHRKVGQELAVAGEIQATFLPDVLPTIPGWQLAAVLKPARQTAGDFYDLIPLPGGRVGILIADVTDKGMGAALYMALSRTLFRTYAAEYARRPELVLSAVNERILMDTRATLFVTVFYGILDPESGTLTYCNAGHNPPYLLKAQEPGVVRDLSKTGMALGLFEGMTWQQDAVSVAPGDALVLYTDGIPDAQDGHGTFFGAERLRQIARAHLGRPAGDVQRDLMAAVDAFVGDAPQSDDITLMVVTRDV